MTTHCTGALVWNLEYPPRSWEAGKPGFGSNLHQTKKFGSYFLHDVQH